MPVSNKVLVLVVTLIASLALNAYCKDKKPPLPDKLLVETDMVLADQSASKKEIRKALAEMREGYAKLLQKNKTLHSLEMNARRDDVEQIDKVIQANKDFLRASREITKIQNSFEALIKVNDGLLAKLKKANALIELHKKIENELLVGLAKHDLNYALKVKRAMDNILGK